MKPSVNRRTVGLLLLAAASLVSAARSGADPSAASQTKIKSSARRHVAGSTSFVGTGAVATLLTDDPPPFPLLDEFAGHDLVAPISPNGAGRRLDADRPAAARTTPASGDPADGEPFLGSLETNVTAGLGRAAFLRCRLKSGRHQVTWIRMRDWHILTSGVLTYTADARFRVKHAAEASEWTLEIKYLQKRDEGTYYCQIPTRTGTAVHAFHLHVASPQAVILGGHVSHVDIHTPSLTLVCIVDNTPDPPQVIFWYHNGTLLKDGKYPERTSSASASSLTSSSSSSSSTSSSSSYGSASSRAETGVVSSHLTLTATRTMSMLTLQHIQHIHSGNYTCQAPNAEPDTTQLFVTQRREAAVHRSSPAPRNEPAVWLLALATLVGHVGVVRRTSAAARFRS